jgi:hypothetical protein
VLALVSYDVEIMKWPHEHIRGGEKVEVAFSPVRKYRLYCGAEILVKAFHCDRCGKIVR